MVDPRHIVARVRSHGADIKLAPDGRLQVVNGHKLPQNAVAFIRENARSLIEALTDEKDAKDERAAIIEYEGNTPRQWAEAFAEVLYTKRPAGISELDWTWFLTRCARIIDEAPQASAA